MKLKISVMSKMGYFVFLTINIQSLVSTTDGSHNNKIIRKIVMAQHIMVKIAHVYKSIEAQ